MRFFGAAHVFGNDVNTDDIIPARYLNTTDPQILAAHCMEDVRPGFAGQVQHGDILVAGENFGCGSSREHAPIALRAAGIILRRGGKLRAHLLPQCDQHRHADRGMRGHCAHDQRWGGGRRGPGDGTLTLSSGKAFPITPFPPFMERIVSEGGWMPYLKAVYGGGKEAR